MRALLLCLFAALSSTVALGETVDGAATFHAEAIAALVKIDATGGKVSGKVDVKDGKASGALDCDLTGLKTGLDLRDEHMHQKYLETAKFPKAVLKLSPWAVTEADSPFDGTFTIKGEEKPVHGKAHVAKDGTVAGEFHISLKDYPAIGAPSFKGVALSDDVLVSVLAKASK